MWSSGEFGRRLYLPINALLRQWQQIKNASGRQEYYQENFD